MTLTEEQRELVAENHQLIFGFLNKNGLDVDEYYDLAAIGLCKAACNYEKSVSLFSTYAYRCMFNEIFNDNRTKKLARTIPESLISSYNVPISGFEDDNFEVLDYLESDFNLEDDVLSSVEYEKLMNKLSGKYKTTFILTMKGYKQCEIADILGCSPAYIYRIKKKIALIWGEIW